MAPYLLISYAHILGKLLRLFYFYSHLSSLRKFITATIIIIFFIKSHQNYVNTIYCKLWHIQSKNIFCIAEICLLIIIKHLKLKRKQEKTQRKIEFFFLPTQQNCYCLFVDYICFSNWYIVTHANYNLQKFFCFFCRFSLIYAFRSFALFL